MEVNLNPLVPGIFETQAGAMRVLRRAVTLERAKDRTEADDEALQKALADLDLLPSRRWVAMISEALDSPLGFSSPRN